MFYCCFLLGLHHKWWNPIVLLLFLIFFFFFIFFFFRLVSLTPTAFLLRPRNSHHRSGIRTVCANKLLVNLRLKLWLLGNKNLKKSALFSSKFDRFFLKFGKVSETTKHKRFFVYLMQKEYDVFQNSSTDWDPCLGGWNKGGKFFADFWDVVFGKSAITF